MKCSSSSSNLSKQKEGGDGSKGGGAKKPAPSTLSSLYTFLVTNLVSLILGTLTTNFILLWNKGRESGCGAQKPLAIQIYYVRMTLDHIISYKNICS